MKKEDKIEFNIDVPKKAFTNHLAVPFNDRIILSAPFGSGKTYFLKKYFEENKDKYETIHLYPVNYSVASNEDIFELIKYDILFALLGKPVEFEKTNFKRIEFLPFFIQKELPTIVDVFSPMLKAIPKVGTAIHGVYENIKTLYSKFSEEYEEINTDKKKDAIDYLEAFTQQKGSIYEEDFYTQLICNLINQFKIEFEEEDSEGNKKKKETVLIIDDLDRIDPEHIFRILNVFAAQIDKDGRDNKFDFDKIILVFDQHNVRNIFKNRYGADVDYSGYIDKFYAHKVFEFDNSEGVNVSIVKVLSTINIKQQDKQIIDFTNQEDLIVNVISYIVQQLIKSHQLTIRRLMKVMETEHKMSFRLIDLKVGKNVVNSEVPILLIARFLYLLYDNWSELLAAVKESKEDDDTSEKIKVRGIECCLVLLGKNQHMLDGTISNIYVFEHKKSKQRIQYQFNLYNTGQVYCCDIKNNTYLNLSKDEEIDDERSLNLTNSSFFPILYDTLLMTKEEGLLADK